MKSGKRIFIEDTKIKSIEGTEHNFKKDDKIFVDVIDRKRGLCRLLAVSSRYKCNFIITY